MNTHTHTHTHTHMHHTPHTNTHTHTHTYHTPHTNTHTQHTHTHTHTYHTPHTNTHTHNTHTHTHTKIVLLKNHPYMVYQCARHTYNVPSEVVLPKGSEVIFEPLVLSSWKIKKHTIPFICLF